MRNRIYGKVLGLTLSSVLFFPDLSLSTSLVTGGLANASQPSPEAIVLNIVHAGMEKTLLDTSDYYTAHKALPSADHFLQQFHSPSPLQFITNDTHGGVLLKFSQHAPKSLQGKQIRCAVASPPDYADPLCISDIDQGGSGQPFLVSAPQNFTRSATVDGSDFGTVYIANTNDVKNMSFSNIQKNVNNASGSSGTTSTSSNSTTATIKSV